MFGGLGLSFSIQSATTRRAVAIWLIGTVGFVAPAAYGAWYLFLGGQEWERLRRHEKMITRDPMHDAEELHAAGRVQFYLIRTGDEKYFPVVRHFEKRIRDRFSHDTLWLFEGDDLSQRKQHANEGVVIYATRYNQRMFELARERLDVPDEP